MHTLSSSTRGLRSTCRTCSEALPPAAGPGQPRLYCSPGCRRAMEYERRRVQRAIEDVEWRLRSHRVRPTPRSRAEAPGWEAERLRLEDRLRHLLDEDMTTDQPKETT